jgi:signal recognition particle receptor subunit beta
MPFVDVKKRILQCKIVFYGTGMGGKTTNLRVIHEKTSPEKRGKLLSLETETERTLFFDFVPISVGKLSGLDTRFSFYTVPGQSFYNLTRKAILKDVDGIVFVSDSQEVRMEANVDSFMNLEENLNSHKIELAKTPHVIQYNKRDLEDIVPVEQMRRELNLHGAPDFEAVAIEQLGVIEAMDSILKIVIKKVTKDLNL